jgi:hypothetical protein
LIRKTGATPTALMRIPPMAGPMIREPVKVAVLRLMAFVS